MSLDQPEPRVIQVNPNPKLDCEEALIVEGVAADENTTVHIAFHQNAYDGPLESYRDGQDEVVCGVLPPTVRSRLQTEIKDHHRLTLIVIETQPPP